jgi:hypothetical protein
MFNLYNIPGSTSAKDINFTRNIPFQSLKIGGNETCGILAALYLHGEFRSQAGI